MTNNNNNIINANAEYTKLISTIKNNTPSSISLLIKFIKIYLKMSDITNKGTTNPKKTVCLEIINGIIGELNNAKNKMSPLSNKNKTDINDLLSNTGGLSLIGLYSNELKKTSKFLQDIMKREQQKNLTKSNNGTNGNKIIPSKRTSNAPLVK